MSKSKDARIHELEKRNAALEVEVAELKALLAQALARIAQLEKNSRTSSKPPSSDIAKPGSGASGGSGSSCGGGSRKTNKRSIGGQKGHPRNQRRRFTRGQIDQAFEYDFAPCDAPGPGWERLPDDAIHQQVELRDNPLVVTEHRLARYRHKQTGRVITAPAPAGLIEQGLLGPRLRALTATLKGELHASYRGIARLYDDALGLQVSVGYLAKVVKQTSAALATPYDELCAALPDEPVLNLDETGHPDQGARYWLWAAIAKTFSVFRVDKSRGSKVIEGLLGLAYQGVIGSDFFSAYRKFAKDHQGVVPAYCWAHLIREVRYLTTLTDKVTANWAMKLLDAIKSLFKAYHPPGSRSNRAQHNAKQAVLERVRRPPERGEATTLAQRVRQNTGAYFLFLERADVEPTNNIAERALRHGVIQRKLTQGTRGNTGQRWLERMLSVRATCRQQGRSFYVFCVNAITAHIHGRQPPTLLT